jgi:hypothetical protein
MNINAWAKIHVAKQARKATRAEDKKKNRADPNGKRYMPNLDDQYGSSETYDSVSDDSIPEVNWHQSPPRPQRPTVQETAANLEVAPQSSIGLRRSIRNRVKSSERKEGCTCPMGECKWAGECFSPKE